MKKRLLSVLGARPQFIKAAPLIHAIEQDGYFQHDVVHTGQHFDKNMSAIFFEELGIPAPIKNLEVGSASHAKQTGGIMIRLDELLENNPPDMVLAYGDTNSTLAAALAAVKLKIPMAHIEAGLRSFNRGMPEEINRISTDRLADLLFAPTESSFQRLKTEGFSENAIVFAGDLMVDAVQLQVKRAQRSSNILAHLSLLEKEFLLATFHRQENTDDLSRLSNIWEAFHQLSQESEVVLPLHPRTRKRLLEYGLLDEVPDGLKVIEPVGYLDMLCLLRASKLLLTDSGGLQKEAFALAIPCLTLRSETEWGELVDAGVNRLANPANFTGLVDAANEMVEVKVNPKDYSFYGNGDSAKIILEALKEFTRTG